MRTPSVRVAKTQEETTVPWKNLATMIKRILPVPRMGRASQRWSIAGKSRNSLEKRKIYGGHVFPRVRHDSCSGGGDESELAPATDRVYVIRTIGGHV